MLTLLHQQLIMLAVVAPNVLGTRFEWNRCECQVPKTPFRTTVELLNVRFTTRNGRESNVSGNIQCSLGLGGRPNACDVWLWTNHCVDTGICGVGTICYNPELFQSDKFTVNGRTYRKNDYAHNHVELKGSPVCESLCLNYGWQTPSGPSADYGEVVENWGPMPQQCH
jgi:hypothetical protein